ncbi:MAG TPA: hypothetical protein VLU41_15430, partial [Ideonella sp.]|nr:hypothetical protein [Ideonella sp.]
MPVSSASAPTGGRPHASVRPAHPLRVLIVAPGLEVGAADVGAVELARILCRAGHEAIVASHAGRLVADINAVGAEFVPLDVATTNPIRMLRNALALRRLAR